MMAEYKFKDSFEFVPYSRLVFSANHPPKSQDASPAFFRRWIVVPFDRTFADGDSDTIPSDKPDALLSDPAELSGVLNKALEALAAIRTRGLSESDSSRRATDEFRQATDPIAVWLDRKTTQISDAVTPQDQLHREYCRSCADAGRPTISKTAFGRAMKKLRPNVTDYQRTVNGLITYGVISGFFSHQRRRLSLGSFTWFTRFTQFPLSCSNAQGRSQKGWNNPEIIKANRVNRVNSVNAEASCSVLKLPLILDGWSRRCAARVPFNSDKIVAA